MKQEQRAEASPVPEQGGTNIGSTNKQFGLQSFDAVEKRYQKQEGDGKRKTMSQLFTAPLLLDLAYSVGDLRPVK